MSITLDVPQKIEKIYNKFAKEQHISKEELMQTALLAYAEDLEDLLIALNGRKQRLEGEKGIKADEFYKQLGI